MRRTSQFILVCSALVFFSGEWTLLAAEPSGKTADQVESVVSHAQPGFQLANDQVRVIVTETGGHMAPVKFFADSKNPIEPYYVSPWQDEPKTEMPAPVLKSLRGDFFCMPFGGNSEAVNGEEHPPHGEIAGAQWKAVGVEQAGKVTTMTLEFETHVRKGKVTKQLSLVNGQNAVYSKHTIDGFAGRVPLGHHATLAMPEKEGSVHLASSKIRFGMTYPGVFSNPMSGEYQALLPGTQWTDMRKVPVLAKESPDADLTTLPGRYGFADLVQLVNDPNGADPAWMTAAFPEAGYVWFSLKDPKILASTVLWMEFHGRHGHPWNGRNNCLGLEDVTTHFADGLAASIAENVLSKQGVPTTIELTSERPTHVNYIQGVARIPADFDRVAAIEFGSMEITLVSPSGQRIVAPVNHQFIKTGTVQ